MKIKKITVFDKECYDSLVSGNQETNCFASDVARLSHITTSQEGFGTYYIKSNAKKKEILTHNNHKLSSIFSAIDLGYRLCISFDDIEDFDINHLNELKLEYPLFTVEGPFGKIIDYLMQTKSELILKTGRKHFVDGNYLDEYSLYDQRFVAYTYKANTTLYPSSIILSDGTSVSNNNTVYLSINPIPFVIDTKRRALYSNVIIQAKNVNARSHIDQCKNFESKINKEFLQSINDEFEHSETRMLFDGISEDESNRYSFDFSNLTEEEIVEICVNCNIAVFLHGKTGTGKTDRMKALDPDLEKIDFGCTREDGFVGIFAKDAQAKELSYYQPYWYKNLVKKCNDEPDKLHILFLDELTNANKDIQKLAFEVTLSKTLTNNGYRLQLPENSAVVAAGNEANESRSATQLSEPLFSRLAHVYIDTNSEEWLEWAQNRNKNAKVLTYKVKEIPSEIHPAILDFIKAYGDSVLRSKYNGKTPNADPRKWELASRALYECNNPNVLRAFIGQELTENFIEFAKLNFITLNDVLTDNWTVNDIPEDTTQRNFLVNTLILVDDENVDKVREFIKHLGSEYLARFDYEWSKDNIQRIVKIYSKPDNPFVRGLTNEHRQY